MGRLLRKIFCGCTSAAMRDKGDSYEPVMHKVFSYTKAEFDDIKYDNDSISSSEASQPIMKYYHNSRVPHHHWDEINGSVSEKRGLEGDCEVISVSEEPVTMGSNQTADDKHSVLKSYGYKLGEKIGDGSFGKVKILERNEDGKELAVKIIKKKRNSKDFVFRFLPRELRIMKRLKHPHCVKVHEIIETPERMYIVMSLATRGDLLQYIKRRRSLPEYEVQRLFRQLATTVRDLHLMGIIHRDIKCENILLNHKLNIMLTDFGFAKNFRNDGLTQRFNRTYCGSYAYTAPEILSGKIYDGTLSDTWSVGVVLFNMTFGKHPYDDRGGVASILDQIMKGLNMGNFGKFVSFDLRDLIKKLLTIDAKKRATLKDVIVKDRWFNHNFDLGVRQVGREIF